MVNTAFALMLVFSDGYLGGHTTAGYLKDKATCETKGAQMAVQYAGWGHPTSFVCTKSAAPDLRKKATPTMIHHDMPVLVGPDSSSSSGGATR